MWIADDGVAQTFPEIESLIDLCRFNDCAHLTEPGCAVLAAIAAGGLPAERLESYRKLLGEAAYAASKNDHRMAKEAQKQGKQRILDGRRKPRP